MTHDDDASWKLVDYVDSVYVRFGAPEKNRNGNESEIDGLKRKAASVGAKFIEIPQRHIGSDYAPALIERFRDFLEQNGTHFLVNTDVEDIIVRDGRCTGVIVEQGREITGDFVLVAPGRLARTSLTGLLKGTA